MTVCVVGLATDASNILQDLVWKQRVLLVFTPDGEHKKYRRQDTMLAGVTEELLERDVIIIRAMSDGNLLIDDVPQSRSMTSFYQLFNIERDEFRVILLGKDGTIKLNRENPISSDVLFALIDAMPMRQYEMLQGGDQTDRLIR